ncbi:MAG: hypothetical protein IPL32_11265 [Chloracidobacterium sp.]|nr:hypothetical protein [Chloracidobacterium sp.]
MKDSERRRLEAFERVKQFSLDNAADFPNLSIQKINMDKIIAEVTLLDDIGVDQSASDAAAGAAFESKGTARENLVEEMEPIARTARMMEYEFDGITELFSFPKNKTDVDMLNTARAWLLILPTHEGDFINYGLANDFIDRLSDAANAFEASFTAPVTAIDNRVAATAEIGESVRRGMIALRICDAVMQNLYANNPGKRAAWNSASHVERAPQKAKPPTPTPDDDNDA